METSSRTGKRQSKIENLDRTLERYRILRAGKVDGHAFSLGGLIIDVITTPIGASPSAIELNKRQNRGLTYEGIMPTDLVEQRQRDLNKIKYEVR